MRALEMVAIDDQPLVLHQTRLGGEGAGLLAVARAGELAAGGSSRLSSWAGSRDRARARLTGTGRNHGDSHPFLAAAAASAYPRGRAHTHAAAQATQHCQPKGSPLLPPALRCACGRCVRVRDTSPARAPIRASRSERGRCLFYWR